MVISRFAGAAFIAGLSVMVGCGSGPGKAGATGQPASEWMKGTQVGCFRPGVLTRNGAMEFANGCQYAVSVSRCYMFTTLGSDRPFCGTQENPNQQRIEPGAKLTFPQAKFPQYAVACALDRLTFATQGLNRDQVAYCRDGGEQLPDKRYNSKLAEVTASIANTTRDISDARNVRKSNRDEGYRAEMERLPAASSSSRIQSAIDDGACGAPGVNSQFKFLRNSSDMQFIWVVSYPVTGSAYTMPIEDTTVQLSGNSLWFGCKSGGRCVRESGSSGGPTSVFHLECRNRADAKRLHDVLGREMGLELTTK